MGRGAAATRKMRPSPLLAGGALAWLLAALVCAAAWCPSCAGYSPPASGWSAVSAGASFTCGLRASDGGMQCWGYDLSNATEVPTVVPLGGGWSGMSASMGSKGGVYTCGIRASDRGMECWGLSGVHPNVTEVPTAVPTGGGWSAVSCGSSHTCGLRASDGGMECWGYDDSSNATGVPTVVPPGGGWSAVSCAWSHTCGIRASDGGMQCWGSNGNGQVDVPTAVPPGGGWSAVSCGRWHTCGIRASDGGMQCWGENDDDETEVPASGGWSAVSGGHDHTCGIRSSDGGMVCWGKNADGQTDVPTAVPLGGGWSAVSCRFRHTCGLRAYDGGMECWGYDENGEVFVPWMQLGVDIDGEAAGDFSGYSVALSSDGSVLAIGAPNNDGNAGHVRAYAWSPASEDWSQRGQDIDGEAQSDQSGWRVALSSDGGVLAVGATMNNGAGNNAGHVRVYAWSSVSGEWSQRGPDIDGEAANDKAGWSVALSANGGIVAVGASGNDAAGSDAGHVRVFSYNVPLQALTDETIYDAVNAWLMDESSPEYATVVATYGQIGDWDVSQVTSLAQLFCADVDYCWQHSNAAAATFNDDISSWDISSVTSLSSAFMGASAFDVPIGA